MSTQQSLASQVEGQTIPRLLRRNATEFGDLPALTSLNTDTRPMLTWSRLRTNVAALSRGLADLGLRAGQRMVIMASSCPEHLIADLGATNLGAIPCTTYSTLTGDQIRYVMNHSSAPIAVLEGEQELERLLPVLDDLPHLEQIVVIDADAVPAGEERFHSYARVRERGAVLHANDPDVFEQVTETIDTDDPLAMIYTSGTTGTPKAVVLSHRNAIHEAVAVQALHDSPMHMSNIAYLPLAHIAEREISIYMPIVQAGHVHTLADPRNIAGALAEVRPGVFFGVPRVWEKLVAGLQNMLTGVSEDRRKALLEANERRQQGYRLRTAGGEVPPELAERIADADRTLLAPVRQRLGLDNLVTATSGAAALPVDILYFLAGWGIEIQEVWGLSETTGAVTANTDAAFRAGTVGRPVPGVEVRTDGDGELMVRGPIVFPGYLQEDGSIASATDPDGWFATGDLGTIDSAGFVTITDRKKELIITAGGKNISPTKIEGTLTEHPLIGQAIAIGDDRPYITALIVLDDETAPEWATTNGLVTHDIGELAGHPTVHAEIERAVHAANQRLERSEQIRRHRLLPRTWSPESGELTPTFKLRRQVITNRYAAEIDALYPTEWPTGHDASPA